MRVLRSFCTGVESLRLSTFGSRAHLARPSLCPKITFPRKNGDWFERGSVGLRNALLWLRWLSPDAAPRHAGLDHPLGDFWVPGGVLANLEEGRFQAFVGQRLQSGLRPALDRIAGTARNIGGKVEEGVGRATGDIKEQLQGKLDQAAGAAQDLYGQTAEVARDTAVTFEKWLRDTIETKPYAAVAVAFGIGWLIGRTHRPL
jgi:uncharacterized protein YjbJ (UPF0337 family)